MREKMRRADSPERGKMWGKATVRGKATLKKVKIKSKGYPEGGKMRRKKLS